MDLTRNLENPSVAQLSFVKFYFCVFYKFHLGSENIIKLSLNCILFAVNKLIFISEIYKQILFVSSLNQ